MPTFITVPFLLAVIVIGSAVALCLLLLTAAVRTGRFLLEQRRARQATLVRPPMLRAIAGDGLGPELVGARGARGRAVNRMAFSYLARLRGEGHSLMARLLAERGVVDGIIRRSGVPWRNQRALEASRLGLIATAEAEQELERMVLTDPSARVRVVAARGLGKTGAERAASTLVSLVGREQQVVPEGIVASALLELGPEAVPALRNAVRQSPGESPDGRRRAMAADVLGLIDCVTAWPDLVRCASDPEPEVRVSAVRALGHLGVPQATDAVARSLVTGEDAELRSEAARSLGRIGDPRAVPALASSLDDPDYWVAHNAAVSLAALGGPGRRALERAVAVGGSGAAHAREALDIARLTADAATREGMPR